MCSQPPFSFFCQYYIQAVQKRDPLTEKSHNRTLKAHVPIKRKKIRGLRGTGFAEIDPLGLDLARSAARVAAGSIGRKRVGELISPETAVYAA